MIPDPRHPPANLFQGGEIDTEKNVEKCNEYFDSICITDEDKPNTVEGKEIPFISLNDHRVDLGGESEQREKVTMLSFDMQYCSKTLNYFICRATNAKTYLVFWLAWQNAYLALG